MLGDFDDAELSAHGVTSRFFRRNGDWFVLTINHDAGNRTAATRFSQTLMEHWPNDPQANALARELGL